MSTKTYVIIAIVALSGSFALGRYTTPVKVVTETKVQTQKDTEKVVTKDQDQHVETTTVQIKKPDGSTVTTTKTVKDTDTKQQTNQDTKLVTKSDTRTETTRGSSILIISALAGVDVTNFTGGLIYGAMVSRPIVGPIVVGLWGFTNKTAGVAVGFQF